MDAIKIVDKAIEDLIDEFQARKNYFFRERELHYIFYGKLTPLSDLVHPEYPTRKRFRRIKDKKSGITYTEGLHCFEPDIKEGKIGSYDIVVLNQEFYNRYKDNLVKLSSSTVDSNRNLECQYIDIAIEFKYITGAMDRLEIEYDLFKLKQANEVKNKKLIIFTRKRPTDKNYDTMIESLQKLKDNEKEVHIEIIKDIGNH